MSVRSYTKIWVHLIWGTYNREKSLIDIELRKKLSQFYYSYTKEKDIYQKINFVNPDHVHMLIELPTNKTIQDLMQLIKGASSHWINQQINFKFSWARGYAAFSVSESNINKVVSYIKTQTEHHKKKRFSEEFEEFLGKHNLIESTKDF